jgi:hypothetical protein
MWNVTYNTNIDKPCPLNYQLDNITPVLAQIDPTPLRSVPDPKFQNFPRRPMESFALIALCLTVFGYALRLREKPTNEGNLSILLQAGLVAMAITILRLFWR